MVTKEGFLKLTQVRREKLLAELFKAKFPGFRLVKTGFTVNVPTGYSLRIAALLQCDEAKEVVKKVFVLMEEFNDYITSHDISVIETYVADLAKTGLFNPDRDDFWLVTNQKWSFEAYRRARGKIVLIDPDTVAGGLNRYYGTCRGLRDKLRQYGLSK